jgi:hypothetical protein
MQILERKTKKYIITIYQNYICDICYKVNIIRTFCLLEVEGSGSGLCGMAGCYIFQTKHPPCVQTHVYIKKNENSHTIWPKHVTDCFL